MGKEDEHQLITHQGVTDCLSPYCQVMSGLCRSAHIAAPVEVSPTKLRSETHDGHVLAALHHWIPCEGCLAHVQQQVAHAASLLQGVSFSLWCEGGSAAH